MVWLGTLLVVLSFVVFINGTEKVKYGEFDNISWPLVTFGIYHWGHALVLSAFWMLYGIACVLWWSPVQALRAYILFHTVRALVELFMLFGSNYQGLAHSIVQNAHKVTNEQRIQLYSLLQGIIVLSGIIYLYVS